MKSILCTTASVMQSYVQPEYLAVPHTRVDISILQHCDFASRCKMYLTSYTGEISHSRHLGFDWIHFDHIDNIHKNVSICIIKKYQVATYHAWVEHVETTFTILQFVTLMFRPRSRVGSSHCQQFFAHEFLQTMLGLIWVLLSYFFFKFSFHNLNCNPQHLQSERATMLTSSNVQIKQRSLKLIIDTENNLFPCCEIMTNFWQSHLLIWFKSKNRVVADQQKFMMFKIIIISIHDNLSTVGASNHSKAPAADVETQIWIALQPLFDNATLGTVGTTPATMEFVLKQWCPRERLCV